MDADGSVLVHADEAGLRQVLGNLLGNVRTHTPADVVVRLGVVRPDGTVRLSVAGGGPGLAVASPTTASPPAGPHGMSTIRCCGSSGTSTVRA